MALLSNFVISWRCLSSSSSSASSSLSSYTSSSMLRRISSLATSRSSASAAFNRINSWQNETSFDRKPTMVLMASSSLQQLNNQPIQQRRRYSTINEQSRLSLSNLNLPAGGGVSQIYVPRELKFDTVPVYNWNLEQVDAITIPRSVFGSPLRTDILHRVLVWEQAGQRQGTHQAKGRGDVNGSTRKLAPQKKRGNARVGGKNPPHHRGGGRAFPPRPRDHSFDLPTKVVKYGLRVALSTRFAEDQLFFMEPMRLESHRTKLFRALLAQNHRLDEETILLIGGREVDRNLYLASKNIPRVNLLAQNQINVYDILRHQRLLLSVEALPYLTNRLAPESYTKTFIVPPIIPSSPLATDFTSASSVPPTSSTTFPSSSSPSSTTSPNASL